MSVLHYPHDTVAPCRVSVSLQKSLQFRRASYPTNFNAVIALDFSAFNILNVTNSHRARSPFGVRSAFHDLRVIFPSGDPVATTPIREYSRSWNASEVIVGGRYERASEKLRSMLAMGRALIVCRHNFCREQVAMYPCE
jgi:hypothetical protein